MTDFSDWRKLRARRDLRSQPMEVLLFKAVNLFKVTGPVGRAGGGDRGSEPHVQNSRLQPVA